MKTRSFVCHKKCLHPYLCRDLENVLGSAKENMCKMHCCFVCIMDTNIDHPHAVSPFQVEEDRSFIEVSQHGHVLYHVELRRVHGL